MSEARKPPTGAAAPPAGRPRAPNDFDANPGSKSGFDDRPATTTGFHKVPTSSGGGRAPSHVAQTVVSQAPIQSGFADRAPRARVSVPVRYRYQSFIDFVDTQSINVSSTGMFVASESPLPVGTNIQFEFSLQDGFVILKGTAEVIRIVNATATQPKGMGFRFVDLNEKTRKLIERIVEVNTEERKRPSVSLEDVLTPAPQPVAPRPSPNNTSSGTMRAASGVGQTGVSNAGATVVAPMPIRWEKGKLTIAVGPMTAGFFTQNPLLNIKMGGFVVPADVEVPLGTLYLVEVNDFAGKPIIACKGKVVAKQDKKVGIRLTEPDKAALARLQAEVNKLAPPSK